jgi:hypothetical protein
MIQQQKWVILLKSYMAMLKCRFPYTAEVHGKIPDYSYDINNIKDYVEIVNNKDDTKTQMLYMDGDIYFQITPPIWSTETRLIIKPHNQMYKLKYYDITKYESQMFYYNLFDRIKKYQYIDSDKLKYHLMGFDDSYDRVSEFFICCEYRKNHLKADYNFGETVKLLYEIHYNLSTMTKGKNILNCPTLTLVKKQPKEILKNTANIPFIINEIKQATKRLITKIHDQEKSLQQTILSEHEYKYQINKMRVAIKNIESETHEIIGKIKSNQK